MVDGNGKKRASIKVEPDGEIVFRMMDKTGTIRMKIGAGEDWITKQPAYPCPCKKDINEVNHHRRQWEEARILNTFFIGKKF